MPTTEAMPWAQLSAQDQRTLHFAPLWLFSAVVGNGPQINDLERQALIDCLAAARRRSPGPLGIAMLTTIDTHLDALLQTYADDPRSIATGLCQVADLLHRMPASAAQGIRHLLVDDFGGELLALLAPFGRTAAPEDIDKLRLTEELLAS